MEKAVGAAPRVLVVEDDRDFGPKLKGHLTRLVEPVVAVECVDDAVAALASHHYDLLVIDIWLPKNKKMLDAKHTLEEQYDELCRQLFAPDCKEERKPELRAEMNEITALSRQTLERRGGLMVIEELQEGQAPGAIMFLTAIGNSEMREDAKKLSEKIGCKAFQYLVKPQPPEIIDAHSKTLLGIK